MSGIGTRGIRLFLENESPSVSVFSVITNKETKMQEVKLSVSDLSYENVRGKFTVDSIRLDHKKIEDYGLTDFTLFHGGCTRGRFLRGAYFRRF